MLGAHKRLEESNKNQIQMLQDDFERAHTSGGSITSDLFRLHNELNQLPSFYLNRSFEFIENKFLFAVRMSRNRPRHCIFLMNDEIGVV